MKANEKEYDVFISYAHSDVDVAAKVLASLKGAGLECFIDRGDIGGGDDWLSSIASAIQGSCIFLPLISRSFIDSDYSKSELQLALMEKKRGGCAVLPYLIEDGIAEDKAAEVTLLLGSVQWITRQEVPIGTPLADVIRQTLRGGFIKKESLSAPPKALETHCYYHPDRGVVARCVDCGKNLCRECADKYHDEENHPLSLCDICAEKRQAKEEKERVRASTERNLQYEEEKKEYRKQVAAFLVKLCITIILLVSLWDIYGPPEEWWEALILMLSFLPFGLTAFAAAMEPVAYREDGTPVNSGCFLGIILGSLFGFIYMFRDLMNLTPPEPPGGRKRRLGPYIGGILLIGIVFMVLWFLFFSK